MIEARGRAPWLLDPETVFLNHGAFGSCPRPVLDRQSELRDRIERDPLRFLLDQLEPMLDEVRVRIGALIGASARDLALVSNATQAANAIFSSIALAPGDEILVTDHGYAAVTNAARRWAERAGASVAVARIPFPLSGPEDVEHAVLSEVRPSTRLVVLDHVTSPTALLLPVASIVRACAARGVEVFVDGAHAPGMVDVDLDALGAAYATGNLHKWICAPKGAAYLHVRPDLQSSIRPLVTSHGATMTRADRSRFLLEFDWTGTDDPTAILAVPTAIDFLEGLHEDGLAGLRRDNHALAVQARDILTSRLGLEAPCPASMLGSMAALPLPDDASAGPEQLHAALYDRHHIQVPVFPWPSAERRVLRVSAQRYNQPSDYEALAEALAIELNRT